MAEYSDILIEESGLPTRAINSLKRGGFYTMGEVAAASTIELLRLPELGRGSLNDIEEWFFAKGTLVGERRRDLERQLTAMEARLVELRRQAETAERNIAHARERLAK